MVFEKSLFDEQSKNILAAPLAERMRPKSLDDVVGQDHLLGSGRALRRVIEEGIPVSLLFWGPPGTGKTTLARLIATEMNAYFIEYSAVLSGVKQIREVIERAGIIRDRSGKRTVLFIDEIHRFNKVQQDAFLPHVESGAIILVGATTENPSFEVIPALLSRCRVFILKPLGTETLCTIIQRAMNHEQRGLGKSVDGIDVDARMFLAETCAGDARMVLNTLEFAAQLCEPDPETGQAVISLEQISEALQTKPADYDKSGENHFNLISAFQKSVRGSDPQAALYWMSRMMNGGEDPLYIARRMIRIASEDVGLADPNALPLAIAAVNTYKMLGSPEGDLALAEAVIYLATAPKSNTVESAWDAAMARAKETAAEPVPMHIRNAPTRLMKEAGYGHGYVYDHEAPGGYAGQEFLPEKLVGETYYQPREIGFEREIHKRLEWWRKRKEEIQKKLEKPTDTL